MSKSTPSASVPAVAAALAASCDPARYFVEVDKAKGIPAALVVFGPPLKRPTPARLRDALHDAQDRAQALRPVVPPGADAETRAKIEGALFNDDTLASRIRAAAPDTVTPVARLGIAVRVAVDDGHRWVHNRTADRCSRWTYCGATVTEDTVSIVGAGTSAETDQHGNLTIDPGVPPSIAARLRDAYDAAGGVIEPARVLSIVRAALERAHGRQVRDDVYLMPATTASTCGLLAGLTDVGGMALVYPVADGAQIEALAAPVVLTIEEQIERVVAQTQDFIARAAASCEPDGPVLQSSSADTARARLAAVRSAIELWSDRLSLASLDVSAQLAPLDSAIHDAEERALAAAERKRQERAAAKASKAAEALPADEAKRIDDEQAAEERRASATNLDAKGWVFVREKGIPVAGKCPHGVDGLNTCAQCLDEALDAQGRTIVADVVADLNRGGAA